MDTIAHDPRLGRGASEFLKRPTKLFIDGAFEPAASGRTFPVYNPATGGLLANVAKDRGFIRGGQAHEEVSS